MKTFEKKWDIGDFTICFWTNFNFPILEFAYDDNNYYDSRSSISISLILFTIMLKLPFRNRERNTFGAERKYGIVIHDGVFWLHYGKSNFAWDIPFFTDIFHKHLILGKDDKWVDVTYRRCNTPEYEFFMQKVGFLAFDDGHPTDEESAAKIFYGTILDKYDNTTINAKYRVEMRIWRPKWLGWTKLFEKKIKSIDVCFEKEVGKGKSTWKGGVVGCGMDFKDDNETPEECFERMKVEKKFLR